MPKKVLSNYFCQLRRLVFNHSSPVHPVSESRGGSLSVTDGEGRQSLRLILDDEDDYNDDDGDDDDDDDDYSI